jgi:electron transfer flavoprotein alpha subunit
VLVVRVTDLENVSSLGPSGLRIAALVKQIPMAESLELGSDGFLDRSAAQREMNPYCRRAVAKGVDLAQESGGTCTVFTLGPQDAEEVLREAVAWGADDGIHLCDAKFAGSDTLATSRALARAIEQTGPFDLILVGRNSIDGDTGQVGPELAELLDLPFACGVRELSLENRILSVRLEHDDGWVDARISLPAVISTAERLCDPCKVDEAGRAAVDAAHIRQLTAEQLGSGPWGLEGSPTRVGNVRTLTHSRRMVRLSGSLTAQAEQAVTLLAERRAFDANDHLFRGTEELDEESARSMSSGWGAGRDGQEILIAVLLETGRPQVSAELIGAAVQVVNALGGRVVAFAPDEDGAEDLGRYGADEVVVLQGDPIEEEVAALLISWCEDNAPWAVLAPSTAFGREVAARCAAALQCGLVGDAIDIGVIDGELVAAKPAFSGALVADITCNSPIRLVTVRPGVLRPALPDSGPAHVRTVKLRSRGRVSVLARGRDDDVEVLARARVVIGVGSGVAPEEYDQLSALAALLGAELAATRKVTDKGWAPRARQVGITGRSISPQLYVAIGISGKFNHMAGVRSAGTVLAINNDPNALVFDQCDIGMVADWHEGVPALTAAIRHHLHEVREDNPHGAR